ncbi:hypothetical protein NLI96_g9089 [Meripilus lineatus]|uniref:Uncharacterized protein n=1 Tax=Meripilus lineatus TaxID=2056292 RepID=A0AAD5UW40_9APHY|nr:hypothetical protein NLI96_g9089 [Physisporinus lineatus]
MQSCKLPIEVCERILDNLALPAHNPMWDDYVKALQATPTLTLARHPHKAQLVQFLIISPLSPPSPPLSSEPASPLLTPSDPLAPAPTLPTVSTLSSKSPTPPASPVTSSSSHSPQISVSVSNDQPNAEETLVEETLPHSKSGNLAHAPTPESSGFDVSLRGQTQNKIEENMTIPPCYYNWIYKVLTRLPPLLVNLSFLRFDELPTLHPLFIRLVSCFKTIQTLLLTDLENQSFTEIIQAVNRLPQLRSIYFNDSKWDRPVRFFPSRRLQIEGFFCDADDRHMITDTLDWLGSLQDLSGFRHLRTGSLQSSGWNKMHHVLQRCRNSLISLDLGSSDADIFGSLSLSSHSKLECLDIWIPSLTLLDDIALFSSHIFQLLSPSLIYLIIGPFLNLDLESLATMQSSWKDIDDALSHPKFNRLTYFVMNLFGSFVVQHFIFAKTMSASSAYLNLRHPTIAHETPSDVQTLTAITLPHTHKDNQHDSSADLEALP